MIQRLSSLRRKFRSIPATKESSNLTNLAGDREIEWTWVAARIGRYADEHSLVLDFGCGIGLLSFAAGSIGARVFAIDLMPQQFESAYPNIQFCQADVMTLDEQAEQFDLILNCSTIEHVGLSGRYDAAEEPDGDLAAMGKMRRLMTSNGHMLMTLPIGQDDVIKPLHRIYGNDRLPRLLRGYRIIESGFWHKDQHNIWLPCSQQAALAEKGNDRYYSLGVMVLQAN